MICRVRMQSAQQVQRCRGSCAEELDERCRCRYADVHRCRAGAEQVQSRCRAGAEQVQRC